MSHHRSIRARSGRCCPLVEGLEARHLLAAPGPSFAADPDPSILLSNPSGGDQGGVLAVTQVSPAPSSVLSQAPTTISVTFNEPFDPFNLFQGTDFELEQVSGTAGNETLTPLDPNELLEPTNFSAPTDTLTLTVNGALSAGRYRIVLLGSMSTMSGIDGAPLAYPSDVPLADFIIQPPGISLSQATNLGPVGPAGVTQTGALDFQSNPQDLRLYQFTLPQGHFWSFGADVSATGSAGALAPALALFDSQGNPIATGQGGLADPNDATVFAGLAPGVYYVGVSGAGNLPGLPGGYNLVTGDLGTTTQAQPGGPFQLRLLASAEDSPTTVQGFSLNWADPLDDTPTGFTVGFSRAINPATILTGVEVVDQSGRAWPLIALGYDTTTSQLSFAFDAHLPPGQYTLELSTPGELVDLAGLPPVASGEPAGVLATWTVSASDPPPSTLNDLGVLYCPGYGNTAPTPGSADVSIPAGGSVDYHFVALVPTLYRLSISGSTGQFSAELDGPGGVTIPLSSQDGATSPTAALEPGRYTLRFTSLGQQGASFHLEVAARTGEALLMNGVGQEPALNWLLLAPPAPDFSGQPPVLPGQSSGGSSPPSGGSSPPPVVSISDGPPSVATGGSGLAQSAPAPGGEGSGTSSTSASSASAGGLPAAPAGLALMIGTPLIGRPTLEADQISAVGPIASNASAAVSTSSVGLLQGIGYGPRLGDLGTSADPIETVEDPAPSTIETATASVVGPIDPRPAAPALIAFEGLDRLEAVRFEGLGPDEPVLESVAASIVAPATARVERIAGVASAAGVGRIIMTHDEMRQPAEARQSEGLSVRIPVGVGLATIALLHYRRPVRNWLGRSSTGSRMRPHAKAPRNPGHRPHVRVPSPSFAVPSA